LREQRITDPNSGLELSVDDMLRAIHVAPVDEVRWYLNLLDSLGARQLAINELKLVIVEDADVERVRMARSRLITWNVTW
jgi:hypothetical protein